MTLFAPAKITEIRQLLESLFFRKFNPTVFNRDGAKEFTVLWARQDT